MYQFYYSDTAKTWEQKECHDDVRKHFKLDAIRPTMWEEHCLECSAPACFKSCVYYKERTDGRCKRFENGLYVFNDKKAVCGQGVHVKFRQWGNMMSIVFPAMRDEASYKELWKKNEKLGMGLNKILDSKLPQSIRWQGVRIPEYIRRRSLRKLDGIDNKADAFIFHGYSYYENQFQLIVEAYDDNTPVAKTALKIVPGENLVILTNLSEEYSKPNNLIKVYPENNIEAELDIYWCDFVKGKSIVSEQPAQFVKCVVWDLDNTLWDGILIETDDPASLRLRNGVRAVIEELDHRGIIQSIASKNDYAAARDVLKKMSLDDYFLYPQIHWNSKSSSVEQIAKSLNIGIDSLALIDDSIFERKEVSSVWPQVRTYDADEVNDLLDKPEFTVTVTDESRNRRMMYKAEEKRNQVMVSSKTSIIDFLRSCNLRITLFEPITEEEIKRCYELVVRTNQLNMSGNKYKPDEFTQVLNLPGHKNFAFSCADDFGSYGIVGFGQYLINNDELVFSEFAMSCRVAEKYVESALFTDLLNFEKCRYGNFHVIKTKKNTLLRNTLEKIGFDVVEQNEKTIEYRFDKDLNHSDIVKVERR